MEKSRRVRLLCTALVAAVLALSLILVVAVCSREADAGAPEETTRRNFWDMLPGGELEPEFFPDTMNWEDMTFEPPTLSEEEGTHPDGPPDDPPGGSETETEWRTTAPWESGLEWPTLEPAPEPAPKPEWPTLPGDWETLPEEWETLPEEWGVELPEGEDIRDIADELVGMSGGLGMPQGALGAGIASQLTMMNILAEKSDRLYLKMQTFGTYNGRGWNEAKGYGALFVDKYSAQYLPHLTMNRVDQERGFFLQIRPVMDVRVIPYYLTSNHLFSEFQNSDVMATGRTDVGYTLYYRHYAAHSIGEAEEENVYGHLEKNKLYAFESHYRSFVINQYTWIDGTTEAYMSLIIEEQGFDKNDPDIIEKVAAYIQNAAVYNLNYNPNMDLEPNVALAFLGGYKEGVCRHFATAATLLYRALGIPARYTVGFMTDVKGGHNTAVKGMDAHAWVEVYEDGFGWRYVEVTGSAPEGEGQPTPKPPEKPVLRVKPIYMEKKYDGKPLEHTGELAGLDTYLAMGYTYVAEVNCLPIIRGTTVTSVRSLRIYDPAGQDVTDDFTIFMDKSSIRIYYDILYFTSQDETKPYDGTPLMTTRAQLTGGALPEGCSFRIIPAEGQCEVGTGMAAFGVHILQEAEDGTLEDVTDYYSIFRYYGALTVTPATLTLKAADAEKVYDGTPLTAPDMEIVGGGLAEGDTIVSYTVEGSRTRVGRSDNVITDVIICNAAGEDVTKNYMIETIVGTLRVKSA